MSNLKQSTRQLIASAHSRRKFAGGDREERKYLAKRLRSTEGELFKRRLQRQQTQRIKKSPTYYIRETNE